MISTLKNILKQAVLGCQNVEHYPSNKNWASFFNFNNTFIVEISRVSMDNCFVNIYNFNDFQNQILSKKSDNRI